MFRVSILRAACATLLAAALVLPAFVEAFERGPSGSTECRCSNHACCTAKRSPSGPACPLARAGMDCARSRPAQTPGMRAGCGCHQGGAHAVLAQLKAALFSADRTGLAPVGEMAHRFSPLRTPLSSLAFAPDPPPPRPTLRSA